MCSKIILLSVLMLTLGLTEAEAQQAYITVHALNPEGVEINSIEGMDLNSNSVQIYDGDALLGYAAYNAQTHNVPIPIEPGTHTITAKFNGMELSQSMNLQEGETKVVTFTFERTEADLKSILNGSLGGSLTVEADFTVSDTFLITNEDFVNQQCWGSYYVGGEMSEGLLQPGLTAHVWGRVHHQYDGDYVFQEGSVGQEIFGFDPNIYSPYESRLVNSYGIGKKDYDFSVGGKYVSNFPISSTFYVWFVQFAYDSSSTWYPQIGIRAGDYGYNLIYGIMDEDDPVKERYHVTRVSAQGNSYWVNAAFSDHSHMNLYLYTQFLEGNTVKTVGPRSGSLSVLRMSSVPYDLPGTGIPCGVDQPPIASFKSLSVRNLGDSDEETSEDYHMAGGVIRLDPTESYDPDPDGWITSYEWDFDGGEQIPSDDPQKPDVVFKEARVYRITLVVVDNEGSPSESYTESLDLSLREGDLIFLRSPVWSTGFSLAGQAYTHVGMYVGGQFMVEAIGSQNDRSAGFKGVVLTHLNGWSYPSEPFASVRRVKTADDSIRRRAVEIAWSKMGQDYDLWSILSNTKQLNRRDYYCSELIWAAYYQASKEIRGMKGIIDLGNTGKKGRVSPDNIAEDTANTQLIGRHYEHWPW